MALGQALRAYALMPKPALLLEIAQDQSGLGKWGEAAKFYDLYLATHPTGPSKALAKKGYAEAKEHVDAGDLMAVVPLGAAPPPVVAAPPPPPPVAPVPDPAPVWAPTTAEATEGAPPHSHVLAYSLAGVAVAAAVFAVIGWAEVASYNGYVGSLAAGTPGSQALSRQSQANTWQIVAIGTSIATGLAAGAVVLTW